MLAQLEQSLRMGRQSGNVETDTRTANLQFENQRLRTTRAQAAQRLASLLERLQQQAEAESTDGTQENAA